MAIGKRIRFFRNRKGMTQKQLGEILGFLGKTSDVRMAQYESEARTPKQDLVKEMAHILDVSPRAITVPEIDSYIGLMHTLFALEDMYGLKIGKIDGEVCLRLDNVPRMAGAGCPSGTGRDNQRGIRPMAIQISRIRYFKSLEENCTLTRIK